VCKPGFASESNFNRHLAVSAKKSSNLNDQVIESEIKIPNFASYKMMVIQIINAYAR